MIINMFQVISDVAFYVLFFILLVSGLNAIATTIRIFMVNKTKKGKQKMYSLKRNYRDFIYSSLIYITILCCINPLFLIPLLVLIFINRKEPPFHKWETDAPKLGHEIKQKTKHHS